jgi:hypothetical protein
MHEKPKAGPLMLLCAPRAEAIRCGLHFTQRDLARLQSVQIDIHCPLCGKTHPFKFEDAWIERRTEINH